MGKCPSEKMRKKEGEEGRKREGERREREGEGEGGEEWKWTGCEDVETGERPGINCPLCVWEGHTEM